MNWFSKKQRDTDRPKWHDDDFPKVITKEKKEEEVKRMVWDTFDMDNVLLSSNVKIPVKVDFKSGPAGGPKKSFLRWIRERWINGTKRN